MNPIAIGQFLKAFWPYILIGLLVLAVDHYRHEAKDAKNELTVFKSDTKATGLEAELKYQKQSTDREKVSNAQLSALQSSYADVSARYAGLRTNAAKGSAGSGGLPAVPATARPTDDLARDSRLLDLLQYAEVQTKQLMACQSWIKAQQGVK